MGANAGRSGAVAARAWHRAVSVLLDTHYVYAIAGAPGRLSPAEAKYLTTHAEPFRISAVSLWEIRLKWASLFKSGQRKGPLGPDQVLRILAGQNIELLPMTAAHAAATLQAPLAHHDPFDEMLLLQAQTEGLVLLTRDDKLRSHPLSISAA